MGFWLLEGLCYGIRMLKAYSCYVEDELLDKFGFLRYAEVIWNTQFVSYGRIGPPPSGPVISRVGLESSGTVESPKGCTSQKIQPFLGSTTNRGWDCYIGELPTADTLRNSSAGCPTPQRLWLVVGGGWPELQDRPYPLASNPHLRYHLYLCGVVTAGDVCAAAVSDSRCLAGRGMLCNNVLAS